MKPLICAAVVLCLICAARVSYACECGAKGSPRKEARRSKAVFLGEVTEAGVSGRSNFYKFRVEKLWKGVNEEFTVVTVGYGLCARPFEVGQRWLVYAYEDKEGLVSDVCTRTLPAEKAADDMKALGKAKVIRTRAESDAPPPDSGKRRTRNTKDNNAPVADAKRFEGALRAQKTPAEIFTYETGHGFFAYNRDEAYQPEAAELARGRMLTFFRRHLR